jgi:hypothetical protein
MLRRTSTKPTNVGLNQMNKPQLEVLDRDRADVPSHMNYVPNHGPANTSSLPCIRPHDSNRGLWFRLLPLLLAPVSPLLHPRRSLALASSKEVGMENERNFLSSGRASARAFKVEIHR